MVPIIMAYKRVDRRLAAQLAAAERHAHSRINAEANRDRDALHAHYAPQLLALILELRGVYLKVGQVASMLPMVPSAYRDAFKILQDGVPPKPPEEVRRLIAAALGSPVAQLASCHRCC